MDRHSGFARCRKKGNQHVCRRFATTHRGDSVDAEHESSIDTGEWGNRISGTVSRELPRRLCRRPCWDILARILSPTMTKPRGSGNPLQTISFGPGKRISHAFVVTSAIAAVRANAVTSLRRSRRNLSGNGAAATSRSFQHHEKPCTSSRLDRAS